MALYQAQDLIKLLEELKSILVVGPPFTGKTQSLATLILWLKEHNKGPLHVYDLDRKIQSLIARLMEIDPKLLDWLIVHRITAMDQVESGATKTSNNRRLWEEFQQDFNSLHNNIDIKTGTWKEGFHCGAVFIDSLSKYTEILMEYVAAVVGHDFGEKGTDARNDYTKVMNKVKQTIDSLKSLPCITGWIAHDQIVRSEIDGKLFFIPNAIGKETMAPTLAKEFNIVLFATTENEPGKPIRYKWQIRPGGMVRSAGIVAGKPNLADFIDQDYRLIL